MYCILPRPFNTLESVCRKHSKLPWGPPASAFDKLKLKRRSLGPPPEFSLLTSGCEWFDFGTGKLRTPLLVSDLNVILGKARELDERWFSIAFKAESVNLTSIQVLLLSPLE